MIELGFKPAGLETISGGLESALLRVPSPQIGEARQVTSRLSLYGPLCSARLCFNIR